MKNMFEVGKFTVIELVKKKAFIITNIIIFIVLLGLLNIGNILKIFEVDLTETFIDKALIIDTNYVLENRYTEIEEYNQSVEFETSINNYTADEKLALIEEDGYDYIIELTNGSYDNQIDIKYTSKSNEPSFSAETLMYSIEELYKTINLEKLNLDANELASINPIFNLEVVKIGNELEATGTDTSIGTILSLILFMGIYLFAYQVSGAVTTEKTSKIVETLLTSTSSKDIILGKTIGVGLLGICQILAIIIFLLVGAQIFLPTEIVNTILGEISISMAFISFIYFVLGYLLFSFLFALSGAMVNRLEDVNIVNTPVNLVVVLGFYLGYFTLLTPSSILNVVASYVPISSMFSMPSRYFMGLASTTDVLISIGILIITIIFIAYISIRIYSNAILNNGSKMNLKSLIKLYKQKDSI